MYAPRAAGPRAGLRDAAQAPLHLLQEDVQAYVLRTAATAQDITRLALLRNIYFIPNQYS